MEARNIGGIGTPSFTLRIVACAFGIEAPFSMLVPVAYLRLLNVGDPAEQWPILLCVLFLYLLKTALLVALLMRMLAPIERLRTYRTAARIGAPGAEVDRGGVVQGALGEPSADVVLAAAKAAYETPLAFATVWAVAWGLMYVPVTAAIHRIVPNRAPVDPQQAVGMGLFSLACFAAALPLAYSILGRLLSPTAGAISLVARERGLAIPGKGFSLAVRLVILCVCLAVAPTSWLAGMVLAGVAEPMTLAIFALVAVAWARVCAGFLAGALASPFRQVGAVIEQIIQRGDVERLERIPVYFKDEIGALAGGVNAMVDRLEESSRQRERLLEEAAERAAQLQAMLDNLVEGVFACDDEGRVTMINASGTRLFGLSARPQEGSTLTIHQVPGLTGLRHVDGRPFTADELPLVRALAGETIVQDAEIFFDPRTGRDVYLRTSAAPIRNEHHAILGAVAVSRDVTELLELDLEKDQFIRVGAHELKTPVAIMKGYSLALLRNVEDLSASRRKMLEAIDRGADRINRIVDDLLAISQVNMDVLKFTDEEVDLAELVRRTTDHYATLSTRHPVRLTIDADAPLGARGDPERLRQVLASLLDNAIKYSPDGGDIEVGVTVVERPQQAPSSTRAISQRAAAALPKGPEMEAVITVRDHGVGIPADKQGRIFERFYRAHTDTPYDYGGMGVGLFLAKDIITRQGGRIWFDSKEHEGSTFCFTVPLVGRSTHP